MPQLSKKSFDAPETTMEVPKARGELVKVGEFELWRYLFEPGWRYSDSTKEVDGSEVCPDLHVLLTISGRLARQMDDGTTGEVRSRRRRCRPSRSRRMVVGNEPYIAFDVQHGVYERL